MCIKNSLGTANNSLLNVFLPLGKYEQSRRNNCKKTETERSTKLVVNSSSKKVKK